MIYSNFFRSKIDNFLRKIFYIFLIFAQNIDCGYTGTHNLCFGAKIRKIGIPLQTPVFLYKSGVFISLTCFPDAVIYVHVRQRFLALGLLGARARYSSLITFVS